MLRRLRSAWLAGGGAFLLVVSLSGIAAAAPLVTDPVQGFVDLDGNGVADSCDALVVADPVAAAAAFAAADTDGDGTISVTEAAHSGWTGGQNCNHGGYVSSVANGAADDPTDTEAPAPAVCPVADPVPPVDEAAPVDTAPNAHGKAVSAVAQSDAVGGKNCNHGGAVSAAARNDHGQGTSAADAKAHGKAAKGAKNAHGKGHKAH
jgi:hypothetical protein